MLTNDVISFEQLGPELLLQSQLDLQTFQKYFLIL